MYKRTLFEIQKIANISKKIEEKIKHEQELNKERTKNRCNLKNERLYKIIQFCISHTTDETMKSLSLECEKEFLETSSLSFGKSIFVYSFVCNYLWEEKYGKE